MTEQQTTWSSGIDARTGKPALEIGLDDLYSAILHELSVAYTAADAYMEMKELAESSLSFGLPHHLDHAVLADARWGVITPSVFGETPLELEHIQALGRLQAWRQEQMGLAAETRWEYPVGKWKDPDWVDYQTFLNDHGLVTGVVNPEIFPYYVLVAGPPEKIPWLFQQYLSGDYAVGRLWFDEPGDVTRYVDALLGYEKADALPPAGKRALFAAVKHPGDPSTENSAAHLTVPLYQYLSDPARARGFSSRLLLGNEKDAAATKAGFLAGISAPGAKPPALIFTSSHGYEISDFKPEDQAEQERLQGAAVFQDYPGPLHEMKADHYLSGAEIEQLAPPAAGSFAFSYACFSAGTPRKADWEFPGLLHKSKTIAARDFAARSAQKYLARGMLGFIGHVSRTHRYAYQSPDLTGTHNQLYKGLLADLVKGSPVGYAAQMLTEQWSKFTTSLHKLKESGAAKEMIVNTYLARNDYRGFVVLGDPFARLNVAKME